MWDAMRHLRLLGAALAAVALSVACTPDRAPESAALPVGPSAAVLPPSGASGPVLVECPTRVRREAVAVIDSAGGVLSLDGHRLVVPAGAVPTPTTFRLVVPASRFLEVEIRAGAADTFTFAVPATLTLSYERCPRRDIDRRPLRIYHIDPATKRVLDDLGGVDDKAARTVTAPLPHLSGYALGQG